MKNNRFVKLISLLIGMIMGLSLTSCDDMLREEPKSFVEPQFYFGNKIECTSAVNYLYTMTYGFYGVQLFFITELSTDLAYFNGNNDPAVYFAMSPSNPGISAPAIWSNCYKGVVQCNNVISRLGNANIDSINKGQLMGETSFLRSFYYYILTSTFGDVPFFYNTVYSFKDQNYIATIPRMSAIETRDSCIKDLSRYLTLLPEKRPTENYQRITRQAAYVLMAKLEMLNNNFSNAISYLEEVRSIYGELSEAKYPLTDTYLSKDNTAESIFEIQYINEPTGIQKNSGISVYMTPAVKGGTDIFDNVHIPLIGTAASVNASAIPTNYFINLFESIKGDLDPALNGKDPRRYIILGYDYNNVKFWRVSSGGKPWFGIKFWCPNMINYSDGNNPRVFRYADAVLMLAECYNEMGNAAKALELLKEIRKRAGYVVFFNSTDKKAILKEIQNERARELMGDFQRKFDLVRWGIFYDQVKSNADIQLIKNNIRPYHKYLPIPDTEVLRTDGILTNDEYQAQ